MPVRTLAALPLVLALTLALAACSSAERRHDVFGSDSDDYGVAPSGPIGPVTVSSPGATAPAADKAPGTTAPAADTVPGVDMATGVVAPVPAPTRSTARPIYEGFAQPAYPGYVQQPAYPGYAVPAYPQPTHPGYAVPYPQPVYPGYAVPTVRQPVYPGYVVPSPTGYPQPMVGAVQPYPAPTPGYWESHEEAAPPAPPPPRSANDMTLGEIKAEMDRARMLREEVRSILGDAPPPPPVAQAAPYPPPAPRYRARRVPQPCKRPAAKKDVCNPCNHDSFVGGFLGVFPGLGFGIEYMREFDETRNFSYLWDVSFTYQDLYDIFDDESLTGKYNSFRVGVAVRGAPRSRIHPTARAGITWFRASGNPDAVSVANFNSGRDEDYFGFYVAVGVEFDISDCVSTGPEVGYVGGLGSEGEWGGTLETRWHFLFKL